jgi:hypothetical protein
MDFDTYKEVLGILASRTADNSWIKMDEIKEAHKEFGENNV